MSSNVEYACAQGHHAIALCALGYFEDCICFDVLLSLFIILGIPYLTHAEKESMKEHVREKHVLFEQQAMNSEQSPGFISPMAKKPVEIPAEQKDFIDAVW